MPKLYKLDNRGRRGTKPIIPIGLIGIDFFSLLSFKLTKPIGIIGVKFLGPSNLIPTIPIGLVKAELLKI